MDYNVKVSDHYPIIADYSFDCQPIPAGKIHALQRKDVPFGPAYSSDDSGDGPTTPNNTQPVAANAEVIDLTLEVLPQDADRSDLLHVYPVDTNPNFTSSPGVINPVLEQTIQRAEADDSFDQLSMSFYPKVGRPTYTGVPNQLTVPINNVATPVSFLDPTVLFAPKLDRYYYQSPYLDLDFVNVNRSLQSYIDIPPGTPITSAKGAMIDTQTTLDLQDDPVHAGYIIQIGYNQFLDTFENCQPHRKPTCLFSMANNADGLLDTSHRVPYLLTADHNNARAIILDIDNKPCVVLYAVKHIPAYTDIMWNYNISPLPTPQNFPTNGLRSAYDTVLDLEERLADISVSDESAQLTALGSYHEHNDTDT